MKMSLKHFAAIAGLAVGFSTFTAFLPPKQKLYISDYENVLGTSMEIKIAANGEQQATSAEQAALSEIDRLNKILSGYDQSSEFCKWMKGEKKPVTIHLQKP